MTTYTIDEAMEVSMLAQLINREARGEKNRDTLLAVGYSVRNRVLKPRWWGRDWLSVMAHQYAYSWMNPPMGDNDPNLRVWVQKTDPKYALILDVAESAYAGNEEDPSGGATHYYDRSLDDNPPSWATASGSQHVKDMEDLHFYICS